MQVCEVHDGSEERARGERAPLLLGARCPPQALARADGDGGGAPVARFTEDGVALQSVSAVVAPAVAMVGAGSDEEEDEEEEEEEELPRVAGGGELTNKSKVPRQSLGGGRQKSIPPQGSGFQKWDSQPVAISKNLPPPTLWRSGTRSSFNFPLFLFGVNLKPGEEGCKCL